MNQTLRNQTGQTSTDKPGGIHFLLACIAEHICPKCGREIYSHAGGAERIPGDPIFYICLECGWNDYV